MNSQEAGSPSPQNTAPRAPLAIEATPHIPTPTAELKYVAPGSIDPTTVIDGEVVSEVTYPDAQPYARPATEQPAQPQTHEPWARMHASQIDNGDLGDAYAFYDVRADLTGDAHEYDVTNKITGNEALEITIKRRKIRTLGLLAIIEALRGIRSDVTTATGNR